MSDKYTPITYKEAETILNLNINSIRRAAGNARKVLTRIPSMKRESYLALEQVQLFKNKPLSLDALSSQEKVQWQEIKNTIENTSTNEYILMTKEDLEEAFKLFFSQLSNMEVA